MQGWGGEDRRDEQVVEKELRNEETVLPSKREGKERV